MLGNRGRVRERHDGAAFAACQEWESKPRSGSPSAKVQSCSAAVPVGPTCDAVVAAVGAAVEVVEAVDVVADDEVDEIAVRVEVKIRSQTRGLTGCL